MRSGASEKDTIMAHAIASTRSLSHSALDALHNAVVTVKSAVTNRLEYNRIVRELDALGTRELDDMGIARYEIREIAEKAVYGR